MSFSNYTDVGNPHTLILYYRFSSASNFLPPCTCNLIRSNGLLLGIAMELNPSDCWGLRSGTLPDDIKLSSNIDQFKIPTYNWFSNNQCACSQLQYVSMY